MSFILRVFRRVLVWVSDTSRILLMRCAYQLDIIALRRKVASGGKVRVLFLVNEISKWKTQSLWDLMVKSGRYEPVIGVELADLDFQHPDCEQVEKMAQIHRFFADRGMAVIDAYDIKRRVPVDLYPLHFDMVFYPQPWGVVPRHQANELCHGMLTCYVPYFVQNYGSLVIDYGQPFHKELWRHFIINRVWEREYGQHASVATYAGRLMGLGHTELDYYYLNPERTDDGTVIYAPHWSIVHPNNPNEENYSTFLQTGRPILAFAQAHREFKWVFKPHPTLRFVLRESGAMTEAEIEAYWQAWAEIGEVCQTKDYPALFIRSKAMITDCGSFLTEYFTTGKPLIHLLSPTVKLQPMAPAKEYFDTFYQVHDLAELAATLETVLCRGEDPRLAERQAALKRLGFAGNYAALNIINYFNRTFGLPEMQA